MRDTEVDRQPKLPKKLVLHKETVRVLSEKELAGIEGGFSPTLACSGNNTCACGGSCGSPRSTCNPG
jgi:bacteriocin-like protein